MYTELELVVLVTDHPEIGLRAGDVGTVLAAGPRGRAYRVEFASPGGAGAGVLRVPARELRPVAPDELFHVRRLPGASADA